MATTGTKQLPYPAGTDLVRDGDDAMRRLAQSVDNMVQAGVVTIQVNSAGNAASQVVTFPVPFAAAPVVVASDQQANANTTQQAKASAVTPTGFQASAVRATTGPVTVHWIAVGPVTLVT